MKPKNGTESKKPGMMMEPSISDGLDQPMKIKAITFTRSFQLIDNILAEAKRRGDDRDVNNLLENFATASQVIGVSLAKLLYGALQIWPEITGAEYKDLNDRRMHFVQTMYSKYGYSKNRVERYLLAWEFIERHRKRLDAKTEAHFLERPIKDLIALGQNCRENGDFTSVQLKTLAATEDNAALRKKIAKIRTGDEKNSTVMSYDIADDGTLTVWEGGATSIIGFVAINPDYDPDLGARAIARLKRRLQISE